MRGQNVFLKHSMIGWAKTMG